MGNLRSFAVLEYVKTLEYVFLSESWTKGKEEAAGRPPFDTLGSGHWWRIALKRAYPPHRLDSDPECLTPRRQDAKVLQGAIETGGARGVTGSPQDCALLGVLGALA
jgi:hypothetical protein